MIICPKCGAELPDGASFCGQCGTALATNTGNAAPGPMPGPEPQYEYMPEAPIIPPYDHTAEFDPRDISEHKVYCMLIYLMGTIGIIVALLGGQDSPYTKFHVREGLKLSVTAILLGICAAVLCWTIIVPIAAGIAEIIIFVLRIIAFFQICSGKAVEPGIVRGLGFLK